MDSIEILKRHNAWRRGLNIEMENAKKLGLAIDDVIRKLEIATKAINSTIENNLHLADGDNCTLIELVKAQKELIK